VRTIAPGRPYGFLNGVVSLDLDPATAAERVAQVEAMYQDLGLPLTWWITPRSRPADIAERLATLGMHAQEDEAGMAIDLAQRTEPSAVPSGVDIEPVGSRRALAHWVAVMGASYGWADPVKAGTLDELYDPEARDGLTRPGIQVIGRLDGKPVGCGSLFEAGGYAWVTNIGTIPEARGRGIGTAITGRLLTMARDGGHRHAYLAASKRGEPVYRRLGFVVTCRLGRFVREGDPA
jgi:GNAT superfamily N-acetyltransferase